MDAPKITDTACFYRDSPDRWIDRAEQMRNNAEAMATAEGRRICLTIAEQYYCMAQQAQHRLDWKARRFDEP